MDDKLSKAVNDICAKELVGKKINEQPMCILIGGLPGSGKSNLVERIKKEYPNRDFVVIDCDEYRSLHPMYNMLKSTPERIVNETCSFANAVEAELIRKSFEGKKDIISVTTLRNAEAVNRILYEPATKLRYKTEIDVMSVPVRESGLSAQNRYEMQIQNGECPRFTPVSFILKSATDIKNTIMMFQQKSEKPNIKVYSRGESVSSLPIKVFDTAEGNTTYYSAVHAYVEPVRQISRQEAELQINELYKKKAARGADKIEYDSLELLEEMFEIESREL